MSDFQTIDSIQLETVNGGAIPIKPIIRGVEKGAELVKDGYQAVKPYAGKVWKGIEYVGTGAAAVDAAHGVYNYFFGPKQQPEGGKQ